MVTITGAPEIAHTLQNIADVVPGDTMVHVQTHSYKLGYVIIDLYTTQKLDGFSEINLMIAHIPGYRVIQQKTLNLKQLPDAATNILIGYTAKEQPLTDVLAFIKDGEFSFTLTPPQSKEG